MILLRRVLVPLVAVVSLAAVPAMALNVALPQVPGFCVGNQQQSGRAVLVELVPVGKTVQRFTKMITLQTTPGAGQTSSATYVAMFAKRYLASCPGSTATPVPMGKAAAGIVHRPAILTPFGADRLPKLTP